MTSYAALMTEHVTLQRRHGFARAKIFLLERDLEELLSFIDGTKKTGYQEDSPEKAPGNGPMPRKPPVEPSSLPGVYSISDAQGVAEVAAALRSLARRQATVHRFESSTEIRIPVRVLFELVYGQGSLG